LEGYRGQTVRDYCTDREDNHSNWEVLYVYDSQ